MVSGNTKSADVLEAKAEGLDTAAKNLSNAAALWTLGAEKLASAGTSATPHSTVVVPRHAAGGITLGPQIGQIGEAGTEAILPLSNSSAMAQIAHAINEASGPGVAGSVTTVYAIETLTIMANNPAQMQQQLAQQARVSALSGRPSGSSNLAVAT